MGKGRHQVFAGRVEPRATPRPERASPQRWLDRVPTRPAPDHDHAPRARRGLDPADRTRLGRIQQPARQRIGRCMEIPLFPLHTVLCPGIVLPAPRLRGALPGDDPALPRDGRAVRRRPHPRRARGRDARGRDPGRRRRLRRDPRGRSLPGRPLRPAGRGDRAVRRSRPSTPSREPYLVARVSPLEDEVGDEPRAERLAAAAIRRFVRYLDLMRARDGETTEVLDIRVEIDAPRRRRAPMPTPEPPEPRQRPPSRADAAPT